MTTFGMRRENRMSWWGEFRKEPVKNKALSNRHSKLRVMLGILNNGSRDDWNYYHRSTGSLNKTAAKKCRAIRFSGRNALAITQPTGMFFEPDASAVIDGGVHFKRTSCCQPQALGVGEYLTWDGKCFSVMDSIQFLAIYKAGSLRS